MRPLTGWQRFVARFLPWYDPDAQDRRIQRTEAVARQVGHIDSVRIAYGQYGDQFIERRKHPR